MWPTQTSKHLYNPLRHHEIVSRYSQEMKFSWWRKWIHDALPLLWFSFVHFCSITGAWVVLPNRHEIVILYPIAMKSWRYTVSTFHWLTHRISSNLFHISSRHPCPCCHQFVASPTINNIKKITTLFSVLLPRSNKYKNVWMTLNILLNITVILTKVNVFTIITDNITKTY